MRVDSSNIHEVFHDGQDLFALFTSNIAYKYKGVPVALYDAMIKAESIGKYFNQHIKLANYSYRKIDWNLENSIYMLRKLTDKLYEAELTEGDKKSLESLGIMTVKFLLSLETII